MWPAVYTLVQRRFRSVCVKFLHEHHFSALAGAVSLATAAPAWPTMRCGNQLVVDGDTAGKCAAVRSRVDQSQQHAALAVVWLNGRRCGGDGAIEVPVETWDTTSAPTADARVRIEDGLVVASKRWDTATHSGMLPTAAHGQVEVGNAGRKQRQARRHHRRLAHSLRPGLWRLRQVGNQEMLTAALRGVVDKYQLAGKRLGDVIAGAVIKHSKDFNLVRECVLSSGLDPADPGPRHPARLRHQPRGGDSHRQQDRAGPDRFRHRRRRRHHQRSAGGVPGVVSRAAAGKLSRPHASVQRAEAMAVACGRVT